jgi:DNA-binding transcriptional LysR family regulator
MPQPPRDHRVSRLKLQDLRVLVVAAEVGSMAKAAVALGLSQPSVSYAIANLEKTLAVPLLDRGPQGVAATEYGRALIERGLVALNEMQHAVDTIEVLGEPGRGQVRIGTTTPMSAVASLVIARLTRRYPRMTFHLVNDTTTTLLRLLREREIEIAISRVLPLKAQDISIQTLFDDQLAVIASRSNSWLSRSKVGLGDLIAERWVLPPPTAFLGDLIAQVFRAHGLETPRPTVTTISTYAMALMVASGPFLTIHPATLLKVPQRHAQLAALPVQLKAARHPVALLTLKDRTPSGAAKEFLRAAREEWAARGDSSVPA